MEMGQRQAALIDKNLFLAHRIWAVIKSLREIWGTGIPGSFRGWGCQTQPSHHTTNWLLALQAQCPFATPPLLSRPSPDAQGQEGVPECREMLGCG